MSTSTVEGFSITHAQILDGATDAYSVANAPPFGDFYGVDNGTLNPNTGTYDNQGDNRILSSWSFFNYADLTIETGYLDFPTYSQIYGDTFTSSGTSPNDWYRMPLWSESSLNPGPRPVLLRTLGRDSLGAPRTL